MGDNRLTDIETKLAYLERMISELNGVVYDQQKTIEDLKKMNQILGSRIIELSGFLGSSGSEVEKPPHY